MQLVLLPGMDGTGELFVPLMSALSPALTAQVIAFPGNHVMSYADLEQHVLSRLPAADFVLLGESFSGPLAIAVAAQRPAGLQGVVLCCTFAQNPRPGLAIFSRLLKSLAALPIAPHRLVGLIRPFLLGSFSDTTLSLMLEKALRQVKPEVLLNRAQEVLLVDARKAFSTLTVPPLYLQALQDRVIPARVVNRLIDIQPSLEIARINGPHCLLQASSLSCARVIEGFCNRAKLANQ